jgi:mRNA interferase MazF
MIDDYVPEAGDIVWTDFDPPTGREQGGRRPALVVSPRELYDGTRFLVVCPITSRIRPFGSSVVLTAGSPISGEILVAQMRTLDALARPMRFSGSKIGPDLLSAVRRKIAFLCGVSASDLGAP